MQDLVEVEVTYYKLIYFVNNTTQHNLIPLKSENIFMTEYFVVRAIFSPHFWYISTADWIAFCMRSCHQLAFASAVWSSPLTFHEGITNNRILPMNDSRLSLKWILMFIYLLVQHQTVLEVQNFYSRWDFFQGRQTGFQ